MMSNGLSKKELQRWTLLLLIFLALLLVGCDEYSKAKSAVKVSQFYKENLAVVQARRFLDSGEELWIGKVKSHDANGIKFSRIKCLESAPQLPFGQKCSKKSFDFNKDVFSYFKNGDIIVFVNHHTIKRTHSIDVNRIAKVEKTGDTWRVTPQTVKQYTKTYFSPDSPFMVYARFEKPVFNSGEKIILNVIIQNVREAPFFVMIDNPIKEFHLKIVDTDTGKEIKRTISQKDKICVQMAPVKLNYHQTTSYDIAVSESFELNKIGNYSLSSSGSINRGLPTFELRDISFEVRSNTVIKIADERVVEIAQNAIQGKMNYDLKGKIILETTEHEYIVTFPDPHRLSNTVRGDYAARVYIDRSTLNVNKILVGS